MPECQPTGERRWTQNQWEYLGAAPERVRGSVGQAAVASPTYVFRRKFEARYKCCPAPNELEVWQDGNYAYYLETNYDAAFPVYHLSVPLPIGGILGELAGALGADVTLADWWTDPKYPDGEKPGVADTQEPNGKDKMLKPPQADCGEKVTFADGTVQAWPRPQTPPDGSGGSTTPGGGVENPPRPIWRPRPKWPAEMDDCCKGRDPRPALEVVEPPSPAVYADGGSWFADLKIRVSHVCGLKGEPVITEWILRRRDKVFIPTPRAKVTPSPDGKGFDLEWSRVGVAPRTVFGAGLLVHIHAVSRCEGILDAKYTLRVKWKPGEKIPAAGSGRWQCLGTGEVVTLAGGDTLPACAGEWVWLGP
jgi:hypothetical protein